MSEKFVNPIIGELIMYVDNKQVRNYHFTDKEGKKKIMSRWITDVRRLVGKGNSIYIDVKNVSS